MLRFSKLLRTKKNSQLNIKEIYPKPVITKFIKKNNLRKWASYIDKYLIFKNRLKENLNLNYCLIHITDQSNAVYLPTINNSKSKVLVTCHDLIAIRQAKKELDYAPKISKTGKLLQYWIIKCLKWADYFACDSNKTLKDLNRLVPESYKRSEVIHLGTDLTIKKDKHIENLSSFDFKEKFIIHVGSAAWYKNRRSVFSTFMHAKEIHTELKLVLVGPQPQINELDDKVGLWLRKFNKEIVVFENISDYDLKNLYENALALVFPSYIEGFGWPRLEAAYYNCPIITVKTGAIYDLLGSYAQYIKPSTQHTINLKLLDILQSKENKNLIQELPTNETCRRNYHNLYNRLIFDKAYN